jgi:3-phosphoshikimate 1-carboxyvinyltransferase
VKGGISRDLPQGHHLVKRLVKRKAGAIGFRGPDGVDRGRSPRLYARQNPSRRGAAALESDSQVSSETVLAPRPLSARAAGPLKGRLRVPGDKSISHRALILGALSTGVTRITGLLEAEDVLNTAKALEALGAPIEKSGGEWRVSGRGVGGLRQPAGPLDFGNSGTGTRLMLGVVAGHDIKVRLVGDASLSKRPMARVLDPLKEMGLEVEGGRDRLPLDVRGTSALRPMTYELPVPSAQVKSAILLAGLSAAGTTTVIESEPTRDHTERMLAFFGAEVHSVARDGKQHISVVGDAELSARTVSVPGDPSSAAFLAAAALVVPGSDVTIEGVLANPTRIGFYLTLKEMGGDVALINVREEGGEPVADIRVRASKLTGVKVPAERAPSMIDEYPILAVVAAFAQGETRMEGLAELKVKESDRLAATLAGLVANGVGARAEGDTLIVEGAGTVRGGGTVAAHLDHRIAMAFLTLSLASEQPVTVDDTTMVATSFPEFRALMESLGATFGTAGEAP